MKSLQFEGNGFEYFKIWIVNILLTIVTLSLYYPWAKVRNLRYFYGNTTLEGRNFDYHATGKQLFVGYLIAIALFIVYTIIQEISIVGGLAVVGILFLAIPWIIWRSLMFSLRMTSFSNVRFNFDGDVKQAYFNFFLLPLLLFVCVYAGPILAAVMFPMMGLTASASAGVVVAILVLVLYILAIFLYALMKKRNAVYTLNGTTWGQGRFQTELSTKVFLNILLKTIGLGILFFILLLVAIAIVAISTIGLSQLQELGGVMNDPDSLGELLAGSAILMVVAAIYIGFLFLFFFLLAYSHARQRNYIFANTRLDEKIPFESTLKARTLGFIMSTNFLLVIFTLGFGMPWAKVRMARYVADNTFVDTELGFDEYVTQQSDYQSSLGDQIGDAFNVDVGIAL